uniref:Dirigent protein n=1 Tax=Aegilops tauschii TaxID=37682 RepID=N1QPC0_AEGTA
MAASTTGICRTSAAAKSNNTIEKHRFFPSRGVGLQDPHPASRSSIPMAALVATMAIRPLVSMLMNKVQGLSLAVMGNILDNGQWAIVGGTGLFKYATGFIDLVPVQQSSPKNISNITIEVCNPSY